MIVEWSELEAVTPSTNDYDIIIHDNSIREIEATKCKVKI